MDLIFIGKIRQHEPDKNRKTTKSAIFFIVIPNRNVQTLNWKIGKVILKKYILYDSTLHLIRL